MKTFEETKIACTSVIGEQNTEWIPTGREYYALNLGGDAYTVLLIKDLENKHFAVCGLYQSNWLYKTCTNCKSPNVISTEQAEALIGMSSAIRLYETRIDLGSGIRFFVNPMFRDRSLPYFEEYMRTSSLLAKQSPCKINAEDTTGMYTTINWQSVQDVCEYTLFPVV